MEWDLGRERSRQARPTVTHPKFSPVMMSSAEGDGSQFPTHGAFATSHGGAV